jgi:hypothetical protein
MEFEECGSAAECQDATMITFAVGGHGHD